MSEKNPAIPTGEMPTFETPTFDEYPELGKKEITAEKFGDLFPDQVKKESKKPEVRSLYFDSKGELSHNQPDQSDRKQRFHKENIEKKYRPEDWPYLSKEEREKYIAQQAPKLDEKDFKNDVGEHIDFSSAQNIEQLIRMVENQKYIINQKGERVPADTVTDLIYDRVLNRASFNKDWTKITLRHRLRETVYKLAEEYMSRSEFAGLANMDLEKVNSLDNLKTVLREYEMLPDINGKITSSEIMIDHLDKGRIDLLPIPLQYKVLHLQSQINRQQNVQIEKETDQKLNQIANKPTLKNRFSNAISRFTSFLKR
jgi:hypothetical protein